MLPVESRRLTPQQQTAIEPLLLGASITDPAFASEYHVFGPVLEDHAIDRWLAGESFPTYTKG